MPPSSGCSQLELPELAAGAHSITARYSGDSSFAGCESVPHELYVTADEEEPTHRVYLPLIRR